MSTGTQFKMAIVALWCVMLTACGPSQQVGDDVRLPRTAAIIASTPVTGTSVTSLRKVSETRVNRDTYDYVFQLTVHNGGAQKLSGLTATLTGVGTGASIIDGSVVVGSINAGATVTTTDTVTIRQNRTQPFSFAALVWQFAAETTPAVPGILLPGDPASPATTALKDYAATLSDADLAVESVPGSDALYYKNMLKAVLRPAATVGQVNAALGAVNGRIVAIWDNDPGLTIQVPDPGSLSSLEEVAAKLEQSGAFSVATTLFMPQPNGLPSNVTPAEAVNATGPVYHQLASRLAPSWSARNIDTTGAKVEVVIADYFGNGPVAEINQSAPIQGISSGNKCKRQDPVTKVWSEILCTHGYLVLGILDGSFGGEENPVGEVTGALPLNVKVHAIDLAALKGKAFHDYFKERMRTIVDASPSGRFVINMSLGDCNRPGNCNTRAVSEKQAVVWRTLVTTIRPFFDYDKQVIQVTSAGNGGSTASAADTSAWNAAALLGTLEGTNKLTNALVVENRTVAKVDGVLVPGARAASSTINGNVGAIGSSVFSFAGPGNSAFPNGTQFLADGGTSSAAPQVAGLAAYMALVGETLAVRPAMSDIVSKIIKSRKDPDIPAAPPIDAYAALLSLDSSLASSPVRRALLQPVAGTVLAPQINFAKAQLFLQAFFPTAYGQTPPAQPDFSPFDLNGDGYTGDPVRTTAVKLDPATALYGKLTKYPNALAVSIDENNVTDFEVLCYYINSELFDKNDMPLMNAEFDTISAKIGRTVSCAHFSVRLNVNTTNPSWTGLPAKITLSTFAATSKSLFSINGVPGNTCGSGERGGPIFSSVVATGASFYSAALITGLPINTGGPGINRRPCSSFYAFLPAGQVWVNATGRGQSFSTSGVRDWEIQVRYSNGDATGVGKICEVGIVPNSGNFAKSFDAVCEHEVGYKVSQ